MAIPSGSHVGRYEILGPLGAGGMGEVYRARDTRLDRIVAIKVLPAHVSQDPERKARFEREAKTVASLNHPHICVLHDVGHQDGVDFLVMEYLEGETLAERVAKGPLPIDQVLRYGTEIAGALARAHKEHIVHRDLKPANVKVTPDGKVKVLDFGLAKAFGGDGGDGSKPELSHSPTMTRAGTVAGMILGTAAYMSPEQAKGKTVDRRADIWSFGVVLYEMLSGRRLFEAETVSEILAAVLRADIDLGSLPPETPPRLRRLLTRCLDRDPKTRLRDIGEARVEIAKIEAGAPESGIGNVAAVPAPAAPTRRVAGPVIAKAALAMLATFALTRWFMPRAAPIGGSPTHVSIALPDGDEVGAINTQPLAVSEDGARIAYVGLGDGKTQIYLRTLSEPSPKALDGTEGGESPFFSPDGRWIGFFAGSKLRKLAVGGAAVQTLADTPYGRGGAWGGDGYIYFAPTNGGGIWRVPESGGLATEVTRKDLGTGEISHRWPHVIAGTNTLLFGIWTGPGDDEHAVAFQTIGEAGHHVLVGGDAPRYAAKPGILLYSLRGQVFAVPWRPAQKDLGQAVPTAMPERTTGLGESAGNYAVATDGTLVYVAGGRTRNAARLVFVDRAGKIEAPPLPERNYANVKVSADGKRVVVEIEEGTIALWMYDFARNTLTPIGSNAGSSQAPVWTADGARVIYRATRKGLRNIYWRAADGSGDEEPLTSKADVNQAPSSVSPDGHWLVFDQAGAQETGGVGIWVMRLDGDRTPRPLFPKPAGEGNGQISPDGRWIAYEATVSSRGEIYVAPFPGPGPRHQVSTAGGAEPLWSRDGRELFFQQGARLMGVGVTLGAAFSASAPHVVHEGRFLASGTGPTAFSITPDGSRFLRIQQVEPERAITRIDLVLNWFEELRAKVGSR